MSEQLTGVETGPPADLSRHLPAVTDGDLEIQVGKKLYIERWTDLPGSRTFLDAKLYTFLGVDDSGKHCFFDTELERRVRYRLVDALDHGWKFWSMRKRRKATKKTRDEVAPAQTTAGAPIAGSARRKVYFSKKRGFHVLSAGSIYGSHDSSFEKGATLVVTAGDGTATVSTGDGLRSEQWPLID